MAACAGDDPEEHLEVLIGQLVKIMRGGAEVRLSKRAGDDHHPRRAGRRDRRRRPALRAGALPRRLPAGPRHRRRSPARPTTTRSTTCSTPTPGSPGSCATAASSASSRAGEEFDPALLSHEKEGELLRALAEFPRVVAGAAELREPHRVARYLEDTAGDLPPLLRQLPGAAHGRRGAERPAPRAGCCWSPRPGPCWPTASPCSASLLPSGCERLMRAHEAGWAHAEGALRGPAWLREPADPNELVEHLWSTPPARSTACSRSGECGCPTWSPSTAPRRTSWTRRTSAAGPAPSATRSRRTTSSTPARRSCARRPRAGWPRRVCASTSARAAS